MLVELCSVAGILEGDFQNTNISYVFNLSLAVQQHKMMGTDTALNHEFSQFWSNCWCLNDK